MSHLHIPARLADWWRGYSDADVISLRAKIEREKRPGAIIRLTHGEYKALQSGVLDRPIGDVNC